VNRDQPSEDPDRVVYLALHSDEIMRTEVTFRCVLSPIELEPLALPPAAVLDVPEVVPPAVPLVPLAPDRLLPDMLESVVPVTSTLWPTCFFRSLSFPSRM